MSFATSLNVISDGTIRVANFTGGLFRKDLVNIDRFQVGNKNYAGNYLIWMAMGGTKVNFPAEVSLITGKHKALMLNLVRDKCAGFLPGSASPIGPRFYDSGLMRSICFYNNGDPDSVAADIGYDTNSVPPRPLDEAKQNEWLDKAAFNAGWVIYDFLKQDGSQGNWGHTINDCEKISVN